MASLDVVLLYTNIPLDDGIAAVREATQLSDNARVDAETVAELTKVVLKNNTFEFAGEHFLQKARYSHGDQNGPSICKRVHGDSRETVARTCPPPPGKICNIHE